MCETGYASALFTAALLQQVCAMQSDFAVLHDHLAEACRVRRMNHDRLCSAAVELHFAGLKALDVYRLAQIADRLNVSVDWLLGRSEIMELPTELVRRRA